MVSPGVTSRFELRMGDREPISEGRIQVREDIHLGLDLSMDLERRPTEAPRPGEPLHLAISSGEGQSDSAELTGWCQRVDWRTDGNRRSLWIAGTDPLGLCGTNPQFRTYAGRVPLARIVQRLLDLHVGRLDPSAAFTGSSPTLPQEWLVQFQEPASLFVKRIATSLGHVVYWDRSGFVSAEMGKGPVGNGTPVELRPGKNLLSIRVMHSVDGGPGQFRWTDPVRFTSRTFQGPRGNGASAGKPCSNRVSSLLEPPLVALPSEEIREWGTVVEVETTLPDPTLGAPLGLPSAWEAPNGETFRIERIEHSIDGRGTYRNRLWAVPESRWGMGGWRHPNHLLGPIPAEVTHNADPLKQGRIRVTLLEDPERRASPWIPGILPASGPETGFHWVPEIGQTVLVAAEAATPESLYLLGCVRGEKARIKSDWAQNDNSLKVLASRNGIRILMDDVKGILRMETPKSSIELRADGTIQLKGQELDLEMKGRASLVGKQGVVIDGSRIDLGV